MKSLELASMEIISMVGTARSYYIEAIRSAKIGKFADAREQTRQGDEAFLKGQKVHSQLLQQEANGVLTTVTLLLAHAEDQLMSAETFRILSQDLIDLYQQTLSLGNGNNDESV